MNVLFYTTVLNGFGERIYREVETLVPRENRENYQTIEALSRRLRQPTYNLSIAILLATTREELLDILALRDLLDDVRILLVLPDREADTISKGHTLRPRFLTCVESDFVEVEEVLRKMLRNGNLKRR